MYGGCANQSQLKQQADRAYEGPQPHPPRSVNHSCAHEAWIEQLHAETNLLDEQINILFSRLNPLTTPRPACETCVDNLPPFGGSQLAQQLTILRNRLHNMALAVRDVTATLEL